MKTLKFLLATMIAAALTTTVSCDKDDDPPEGPIIDPPQPPKSGFYNDQNSKFDTYPSECTELGKSEERMACHNSLGLYTANPGEIEALLYQRDGDNLIFRIHKPNNIAFKADGTAGISLGSPNSSKVVASTSYKAGDLYAELYVNINGNGEFGKDQSQPGYLHGFATYYPFTKGSDGSIYYSSPLKVWSKDALYKIKNYKDGEVMMYCNGVEVRCSGANNDISGATGSTSEWCTRLPARYYNQLFDYNIVHYNHAQTWATDNTNFPSDLFDRIENINYNVRPNDIIVYDKGDGFGHIGIVMECYVEDGRRIIKVVEQNGRTVVRKLYFNDNGSVVWSLANKITFLRPHSLFGTEPPVVINDLAISQCAINEEDIDNKGFREFTEGDEIKIVAWSLYDGDFIISINGEEYVGPKYIMENAQPGIYNVSVWIKADGKESDKYSFTINVKEKEEEEVKAPAITQCTVNDNKVGNYSCADAIEYGKNVTISATAESNDCDIKISVKGKGNDYNKDVTKKSYTFSNLEPGDYSVEVWAEKDGKQSNKYEFSITIKEKEPPFGEIESNISFGTEFPSVSENSFIYIKYNGEKIRLQGDEGCELSVKAVYEGNTIKFIAAKSFRQDGVAVLYENGFTTKVDSKSYHQYDTEVIFEIDPENITDKTEYRIALVTDCNDNGYKYKAGYYTAPLVLNRAGEDANRSYLVSPSTGRFLTDIASNNLKTIKASNNKPSYLVDGNAGCDTKIKVQSVNGNTVTLLCTKDGGFRVPGRMIVYEGSSPEQLWYGNIFAEKSYRGNNTQDEVTLKLDVSHITSSTKFGVVILSDEGDGNGTMYGYYSGTITVTPR